jgi:multidrug efflux pump subunit AcrA (membrane-fusion protein)
MVVGALGLLACGVLGGIVASRYLDGGLVLQERAPSPLPHGAAGRCISRGEHTGGPGRSRAVARGGEPGRDQDRIGGSGGIRITAQLPGTVTADAYREVKVVSLVGGIVTKAHVELGATVKRGAPLATLFSSELAEAQTKYLSMRAMLAADHQKLHARRNSSLSVP